MADIFYFRNRRLREKRMEDQENLQKQLVENGLNPDEINDVLSEYVQSGSLKFPTQRKTGKYKLVGPGEGMEGPEQRTEEMRDIELPKKRIFKKNAETGLMTQAYEGPTGDEISVENYGVKDSIPRDGENIYIRASDGVEIRRERNGGTTDKVIKVGDTDGSGGESPQDKVDRDTIKQYHASLKPKYDKNGKAVPVAMDPELEKNAAEAGKRLGLPVYKNRTTDIVKKPGLMGFVERTLPGGKSGKEEVVSERNVYGEQPTEKTINKDLSDDEAAKNHLLSIGAKVTPANIKWAKGKIKK